MPVDLDDLTDKVREQVAGLFPAAGGPSAPVLAFEPVGLPVPASAFELPTAPGVLVPLLARRRVSALANQVPMVSGDTYHRTAFQIDEFYQYLIHAMTPAGGAGVGPLATLLVRARQLYDEGSELDPLNADDTLYPTEAEPSDWYRPDSTSSWTTFRFTTTPPAAPPTAGPNAPRVTLVKKLNPAAVPAPNPRARFKWATNATSVLPAPVALPASALRPTSAVLSARMAVVPTARAFKLHQLAVTRPALAIAPAVRVDAAAPAQAEGIDLEFDLLPVTLNRPWMMLGILADRQWYIPGYKAGEFGSKLIPALPTTMLVARNVTVKVSGSPDDTPLNAVGFGPFSLTGRTATRHAAAAGQTSATLAAPTPQVIGWLAQPLTGLAPLDDPTLPPG